MSSSKMMAWRALVKKTMKQKKMTLTQALKCLKGTKMHKKGGAAEMSPSPVRGGGRTRRSRTARR